MFFFKPKFFICFIYLFSNLLTMVYYYTQGYVEQEGFRSSFSWQSILFCQCTIILTMALLFILHTKVLRSARGVTPDFASFKLGLFVLLLQLGFLLFSLYYGVNIAGRHRDPNSYPVFLAYFFILFDGNVFYLIYSCSAKNVRLFKLNTLVYFISMMLRGWMGGTYIVFMIIFWRSTYLHRKLTRRYALNMFFTLLIVVLLLPLLVSLKWGFRLPHESIVDVFINSYNYIVSHNYLTELNDALYSIVSRFSILGIVHWIYESMGTLNQSYSNDLILPYWGENLLVSSFYKMFGLSAPKFGSYIVAMIGEDWNTNTGLAGWFFILYHLIPIFLIYIIFCVTFIFILAKKIGGELLLGLMFFLSIIYLYNGWLAPFVNYLFYLPLYEFILILLTSYRITVLPNVKYQKI